MDAQVIAFVSGKGGTGKSTTSVYVGAALASLGKRVLLVELDAGLRSVDIIAGVSGQTVYDIEDVLAGRVKPSKAIVQSSLYKGLSVVAAPYAGRQLTAKTLRVLCQRLAPFFEYILLDSAAGVGLAFQAAVWAANQVLLVLTPDPVALRDGRVIADGLQDSGRPMRLILNRVNSERILKDKLIRDLDEAIDTVGVQLLGVIPESPVILTSGMGGTALPKTSVESTVYRAIACRLAGEDVPLQFR